MAKKSSTKEGVFRVALFNIVIGIVLQMFCVLVRPRSRQLIGVVCSGDSTLGSGGTAPPSQNKTAELSQRRPRDAPNIWVPWKVLRILITHPAGIIALFQIMYRCPQTVYATNRCQSTTRWRHCLLLPEKPLAVAYCALRAPIQYLVIASASKRFII